MGRADPARRRPAPRRRRAGPGRPAAHARGRGSCPQRHAGARRRDRRATGARDRGCAGEARLRPCSRGSSSTSSRSSVSAISGARPVPAMSHSRRSRQDCASSRPSSACRSCAAASAEGFTREGERVVLWAHRILADYDGLGHELSQIRGGLEGTLRIGAIPTSLPMVSLVTSPFCERHPLMHVEVLSLSSREVERRLDAFELDAGLTYLDNEPLGNVRTVPLYRERYVLLCAADGPFSGRSTVDWAEAATVPLCLLTPDMQNRRILNDNFAAAGTVATPTVETNSISTLCSHVRRGWSSVMAHAWLSLFGVPEAMRAVPLVAPEVTHAIGIVVSEVEPLPPLAAALVELSLPP